MNTKIVPNSKEALELVKDAHGVESLEVYLKWLDGETIEVRIPRCDGGSYLKDAKPVSEVEDPVAHFTSGAGWLEYSLKNK